MPVCNFCLTHFSKEGLKEHMLICLKNPNRVKKPKTIENKKTYVDKSDDVLIEEPIEEKKQKKSKKKYKKKEEK